MTKLTVYHQQLSELTGQQIVSNGCPMFTPIADVEVDDTMSENDALETAYRLTNNIYTSWSKEPEDGVTVLEPLQVIGDKIYGHRSTMVGDVIGFGEKAFKVASCGFERQP